MRSLLFIALLLAACSKGPEADLATISEARSLAAEWALVNDEAAKGKLTSHYTQTMRKELRQQLQSSQSSLTVPGSRYANEIRILVNEPDNARPEELRAHAAVLKQIETELESA
jgi:hypothetical protein